MKYDYSIVLTDAEDANECDVFTGEVEANSPHEAATEVIRTRTDWLEDVFANLAPTIELSRNSDFGVFEADVDSHGLGHAGIVLEKVS